MKLEKINKCFTCDKPLNTVMCNCGQISDINKFIKEAKKEVFDDKEGFWISAITKELCYKQRIIGKIKVEEGKIVTFGKNN